MSSLRMPTPRWVLPVPIPPTSSSPAPSRGSNPCTKRDALIWASAIERSAPGKSVVKFDSSQCSYRFGMRAAAIMAPPRARNRQSQRVTPRSGAPGTGFHPEPAHRGQTSAAVFIIASRFVQEFDPRDGAGLLLVGGIGTGKTHLGVGILKELIAARGSACLFCDY